MLKEDHSYVILFWLPDKLLYYDIQKLESTDHASIAEVLANAVNDINKYCGKDKIFSVCTDNTANLLATTFNEHKNKDIIQKLTNTSIIHVSCGIHSV